MPADSMAPSAPPVALAPRSIAITPRPVSAEENQRAAAAIDGIERELLGAVDAFKPGQWWGRGRKLGRRPAALVSTLERVWMKLRLGVPPDDLFAYAEGAYLEIQRDQAIDHAEQEQEGRKHEPTIYDQG